MAKRKSRNISVPRMMYIFCEGSKTEPNYIESFIDDRAGSKTKVIRVPREKSSSPEHLLNAAIARKKSSSTSDNDVFWVVYDKEDIATRPISMHKQVWDKALKNNINVAMSCVCIEFFILLHFGITHATYTSYNNLKSQSPLLKCLKRIGIDDYDKASENTYSYLKAYVDDAINNAKSLEMSLSNSGVNLLEPYKIPSYTGFHHLLEAIIAF